MSKIWEKLHPLSVIERSFLKSQKSKLRFLLDENIRYPILDELKNSNAKINVRHVIGSSLQGKSDEKVYAYCQQKNRILITHNFDDFASDRKFPLKDCPGVIGISGANDKYNDFDLLSLIWLYTIFKDSHKLLKGTKIRINAQESLLSMRQLDWQGQINCIKYNVSKMEFKTIM